jgi:large subunit ribosomal protein L12
MEYVYAALVLHEAGKDVSEDNVTAILETAGIDVDDARVKSLVAAMEDVDVDEALSEAAVAAPAGGAGGGAAAAPADDADETAEEEETEEEETAEEDDDDEDEAEEDAGEGLGDLFG